MTNNIENFLKVWEKETTESTDGRARIFGSVEVELSKSGRENTIRVNSVRSLEYKKGEATAFFKWLAAKADEYDFTVTLCAQPFGWNSGDLPTHDQLVKWVSKFGFKTWFTYPDGNGTEMYRDYA